MQTSRNGFEAVSATFKRLTKMRRIIPRTKPDRVITLYPQLNVLSILALRGTGIPVYVSEHNDPNLCANGEIWETLRPWVYRWAAKVVSVSQGVDRALSYLPAHKRCVILIRWSLKLTMRRCLRSLERTVIVLGLSVWDDYPTKRGTTS